MTLDSICLLAHQCKKAGEPERCDNHCYAFLKLHGENGEGGLWSVADIPKAYRQSKMHTLPFEKDNPLAFEFVARYCSNIEENVNTGQGYYFYSIPEPVVNPKGTGTGKTTAATAILNEYLVARVILHVTRKKLITELPALLVNASKYQNTFNAQFRGHRTLQEEASQKYYLLKDRMMTVALLAIDDIGIREATEAFKNQFYEVIDTRAVEQLATIYTSNEPIERIGQLLDDRIASRIEGSTFPVSFKGEDKRRGGHR
ncbi:ATP-binding protein [Heliobacterium chlorum]|uniref:ATP-binding protein n=1 Tax=Heliobacterium chlorum TaxID=2698 RepID=A0ABR7T6J2_HELCL|nr:ATP-binding protein [Heliobacterium chlorum]MBC9785847.1 ATP-binding protein [Heliobacterium chlorum]